MRARGPPLRPQCSATRTDLADAGGVSGNRGDRLGEFHAAIETRALEVKDVERRERAVELQEARRGPPAGPV
jgi:hypothetical protein